MSMWTKERRVSAKKCSNSRPLGYYSDEEEAEEEENAKKRFFNPALSIQRYEYVVNELLRHENIIDKLVDFGCSEGKFLEKAKYRMRRTATLIGVDVDDEVLNVALDNVTPTAYDVSEKMDCPLRMKLFNGSVAQYDHRLADTDAVVAIELIEHLNYATLQKFPEVVFGKMEPYVVILTTPNVEFNVMFDMEGRRFRHWDHKFEWTRQEFENWCLKIAGKYKKYWVKFTGVGDQPSSIPKKDQKDIGFATQIAVFRRKRTEYLALRSSRRENMRLDREQFGDAGAASEKQYRETDPLIRQPYKLVADIPYPLKASEYRNGLIAALLHTYCGQQMDAKNLHKEFLPSGAEGCWFDLQDLMQCPNVARSVKNSLDDLFIVLMDHGWTVDIRNEKVFYEHCPPPKNEESSEEGDDEVNFLENSSTDSGLSFSDSFSGCPEENSPGSSG